MRELERFSCAVSRIMWGVPFSLGKTAMRPVVSLYTYRRTALAVRFDVSYGWVLKIAAAQRQSGSYKRVPQRHAGSRVDAELIRRLVDAQPDCSAGSAAKAAEHGVRARAVHLWRILNKLGLRLKKSHSTPSSATPETTSRSGDVFLAFLDHVLCPKAALRPRGCDGQPERAQGGRRTRTHRGERCIRARPAALLA